MPVAEERDVLWRLPSSLRQVLTSSEIRRALVLFMLILVNSVVELLGLATIIPVVGAVMDPKGADNEFIAQLRTSVESVLGGLSDGAFIQWLVAFMIGSFLFKAAYGIGVVFVQTRFSYSIAFRLKRVLWSWHFSRSLERMRSIGSGTLMSEITFWPA